MISEVSSDEVESARESDARIQAMLSHHDPIQLLFQFNEIVTKRSYLQCGIEVDPGAVVFDVGANVGVAALFFAVDCGAGVVHSFEPIEPIFEMLRDNTSSMKACMPHNYGVGAHSQRRPFLYYPASDAMSGLYADPDRDRASTEEVMRNRGAEPEHISRFVANRFESVALECEVRSLSEVIAEAGVQRIDLLKIDVERAEHEVLEGIADQDWPRIRQIVSEVHDDGDRLRHFEDALVERGFDVSSLQDEDMHGTDVHLVFAKRNDKA